MYSIVIPTAGRGVDLAVCLQSISDERPKGWRGDVLVVDNNTDPAMSKCVQHICEGHEGVCRYVREPSPGLTAARHAALKETQAEVLCFVDDDVSFTRRWFESVEESFSDPSVDISGGPTVPRFTSSIPPWFWDFIRPTPYGGWSCTWLSLLDIGHDVDDIGPNWIWGLNFAIRRQALLKCGGFHIDLVPSDCMRWQGDGETGLTMKLAEKGCRAVYRQNAMLFHHCGPSRLTPEYFTKRAYYQGICNSYTELRTKLRAGESVGAPRPSPYWMQRFGRAFGSIKAQLRAFLPIPRGKFRWSATAANVHALCQEAERHGYLFHQTEAANDPDLREWIVRDNYFDADVGNQSRR